MVQFDSTIGPILSKNCCRTRRAKEVISLLFEEKDANGRLQQSRWDFQPTGSSMQEITYLRAALPAYHGHVVVLTRRARFTQRCS